MWRHIPEKSNLKFFKFRIVIDLEWKRPIAHVSAPELVLSTGKDADHSGRAV
jgi:hypothetical protein